jgi:hypothetical protein
MAVDNFPIPIRSSQDESEAPGRITSTRRRPGSLSKFLEGKSGETGGTA